MTGGEAALAAAGVLGPFFAVDVEPTGVRDWVSVADLLTHPELLDERVQVTRGLLSRSGEPVELRIAASITQLGLAARLVSPVLGAAVLTSVVPIVDPVDWLLAPPASGPVPVAARRVRVLPGADPAEAGAALLTYCIEPVLAPLTAAVGALAAISARVLWGNVASAVTGAARMCGRARPDLAERAAAIAAVALAGRLLAGTGQWLRPDPQTPRWFFVRRSCCLLYRLPGAAPCGDCILLDTDVRRQQWAQELPS